MKTFEQFNNNPTLYLTLKKEWFDMIASGEKKEEYREIKDYWLNRLFKNGKPLEFKNICFKNGYSKNCPVMWCEFKGIDIDYARPEWSGGWDGEVIVIKIGDVLSVKY